MGGAGAGGGDADPQQVPRGARGPPVAVAAGRRPCRHRGGPAVVGSRSSPAAKRPGRGSELHIDGDVSWAGGEAFVQCFEVLPKESGQRS